MGYIRGLGALDGRCDRGGFRNIIIVLHLVSI